MLSVIPIIIVCMGLLSGCADEYDKGTYTITNAAGEEYEVKYREFSGFPDTNADFQIYSDGEKIADYTSEYGNRPRELLYLFSCDDCDYYYAAYQFGDFIFACGDKDYLRTEGLTYGKALPDDYSTLKSDSIKEEYRELSERMNSSVDSAELREKFELCGYDVTDVARLYNYSDDK